MTQPGHSASDLDRFLAALGDELTLLGAHARVLVVGGAALVMRGVVARQTGDVDVLAEIRDGHMTLPRPFSAALATAIGRVAASFPSEIDAEWVNAAVAKDWESRWPAGLPPGLDGAEWRSYGGLDVGFAGRETLIAMKMHAVLDRGTAPTFDRDLRVTGGRVELTGYDRRHLTDLVALAPTDGELASGEAWVLSQDGGDVAPLVRAIVERVRAER